MLNKDFEILEILERDARISPEDVAAMLGAEPAEVRKRIADLEANGTILGYKAIVNQERVHTDRISCVIEVCVTPERGYGFDRVAERIYRFPEVRAVYLMSGSYDLLVIIEGKTMKEIAQFVIDKLATLENVRGTATRFMLKKYKELGVLLEGEEKVHRMPVTP
ncbi:MAG TPA: Lrp/AsnC family transcriptional regulator [bacterium]|nr:Lrp/AsnC family transcriptional regulator [bacterium]HQL63437.1 Lrp/AsnC family transcriptional regulator [bacterium]